MFYKLIIFFFIFLIKTYGYDENIAYNSIKLSQASYCISSVNNWNCTTCDSDIKLEYVVEDRGVRAIQGYNGYTNTLFIAFRGSSDLQNWLDNIKFRKISPYNNQSILIENGFYKQYTAVKETLINNLLILKDKYNNNRLLLTGHSSGAAIATIMTYDIATLYPIYKIEYLVNFGSPRVGNQIFVDSFNSYSLKSYRITHYYDMVPHIPQEFTGYRHISNEIWYNEYNSQYRICNDYDNVEDKYCSNSCSPLHCTSTTDHLNYLNISMGNADTDSCISS